MRMALALAVLTLAPATAWAGDFTMTVRNKAGVPVQNAVVMVYPTAGAAPRITGPYVITQKDITFDPFVMIVPVGAEVKFPNKDKVRHHVYSFSAGNRFEIKLYGKDETRSVVFKAPGAAAIGCNIHDRMAAYVRVVDTPFAVKTGADGIAIVRGVPGGSAAVRVWHPYLRAPKNEVAATVVIPAQGAVGQAQSVEIRAPANTHQGH